MEIKDRTQASYTLIDINEQARIAFEKCKETREQKIERLKKELIIVNDKLRFFWDSPYGISMQILDSVKREKANLEQQLKELEDDTRN